MSERGFDPPVAIASPLGAIAAHAPPRFAVDALDAAAMQNMMVSMSAMAEAQLRRFDAAGVLVLIFDSTGQAVMALERPQHHGITDEYVRGALMNLGGGTPIAKPKKRR